MNIRNKKWLFVFTLLICGMLVATGIEAKKPIKPDSPDETTAEWIVFTGGLVGDALVEDCCPNSGPFPAYEMTLPNTIDLIPAGTYAGHLFINYYGVGRNREYIVQFWTETFGVEIIGGLIDYDKKAKFLTVTFENAPCKNDEGDVIALVNFVLERFPN